MTEESNVTALRSVSKAVNGSRRDLLVALRDLLWDALQDERTQPRDLSPLTLRLKELQAEITQIDDAASWDMPVGDAPFDPESI